MFLPRIISSAQGPQTPQQRRPKLAYTLGLAIIGWNDPERGTTCFPGLQTWFALDMLWVCARELGVGQLGVAGLAEAQQLDLKLSFIFRFKRPREYLPRQSFTFLSFYLKLTDLVISITCLCLFFLLIQSLSTKIIFLISVFHYEQLLDTYSIKKSTFDWSSLILSII